MLPEQAFAEPYKSWAQVASNLGSVAALITAAIWFVRTSKFRQRIQFDLDCKTYALSTNLNQKIAEIHFCFENKGFVEHRIYNLTVSIHSLESENKLDIKTKTGELQFKKRVLASTNIVPRGYGYYFVRPGVRQVITHIIPIDAGVSLIRVTAGFQYDQRSQYPHTVRRVFPTVPINKPQTTSSS